MFEWDPEFVEVAEGDGTCTEAEKSERYFCGALAVVAEVGIVRRGGGVVRVRM